MKTKTATLTITLKYQGTCPDDEVVECLKRGVDFMHAEGMLTPPVGCDLESYSCKAQVAPQYPNNVYTAWCQQKNGEGTIWISSVKAPSVAGARKQALKECSEAWQCKPGHIHVLGIAEGDVHILEWEDLAS